jgi:hypothetical protein
MKTTPIYPLGREDREAQKLLDRIKTLQAKGTASSPPCSVAAAGDTLVGAATGIFCGHVS